MTDEEQIQENRHAKFEQLELKIERIESQLKSAIEKLEIIEECNSDNCNCKDLATEWLTAMDKDK